MLANVQLFDLEKVSFNFQCIRDNVRTRMKKVGGELNFSTLTVRNEKFGFFKEKEREREREKDLN